MDKLLLVDGMNLYFQMYCGMPARIVNGNGIAIQGTLGFVGAFLRIINMINPTHVLVLFDAEQENARAELLPEYKANRDYAVTEDEDNPFSQLPDVYRALDFMRVTHGEVIGEETDDAIASYVRAYEGAMEITIASQDSDFYQLIGENTRVLRYRGDNTILCDETYVREKCGIAPTQYADFKSLTGDTSDNIRGAEKVGTKTAAWLLNTYGTLEEVIARADDITKPSIRESIKRNADRLRLNRRLIKLKGEGTLPFTLAQAVFCNPGIRTNEVLRGIGLR